ncbi:MAG: hypothetical protein ACT4PT_02295 [Methanobacteriota archaeon]
MVRASFALLLPVLLVSGCLGDFDVGPRYLGTADELAPPTDPFADMRAAEEGEPILRLGAYARPGPLDEDGPDEVMLVFWGVNERGAARLFASMVHVGLFCIAGCPASEPGGWTFEVDPDSAGWLDGRIGHGVGLDDNHFASGRYRITVETRFTNAGADVTGETELDYP